MNVESPPASEILIDEETLRTRVAELGDEISTDYEGRDLLLVGVLKGAVFFMADLMREISLPCEVDFMAISSYGDSTDTSGIVRIPTRRPRSPTRATASGCRTTSRRCSSRRCSAPG